MQLNSIIIVVANLTLLPWFRRLLERYSMPAMLRTGFFGIALCQFFVGFVAPGGTAYYAATMVPNGICWALINFVSLTPLCTTCRNKIGMNIRFFGI